MRLWGNGDWRLVLGYGYDDIYAGLFGPYGLMMTSWAICRRHAHRPRRIVPMPRPTGWRWMCGEDNRDIAGLAGRSDGQGLCRSRPRRKRAALEDLANVSATAAQQHQRAQLPEEDIA